MAALVVAVAGAAGVGIAGPYVAGGVAEDQYDRAVRVFSDNPSVEIQSRTFDRGVRRSHARTELVLAGQARDAVRELFPGAVSYDAVLLVVEDTIHHGPVFLSRDHPLAAARVDTRVLPGAALLNEFPELDGDQSLITADTTVALDGDTYTRFHAPATDWSGDGSRLAFSPLQGRVDLNADMDEVRFEAALDDLRIQSPEGAFQLNGMSLDADSRALSRHLWVGSSTFNTHRFQWESGSEFLQVDGLAMQWSSDVADGLLEADVRLTSDAARAPATRLEGSRLRLRASNIDQWALEQVLEWSEALEAGELSQQQLAANLMGVWPQALEHGPSVSVEEFELGLEDGPVSGRARLGWSAGVPSMNNPFALVNGIDLELTLAGPEPWMRRTIAGASGSPEQTQQTIDSLVQQGLLVRRDGELSTEIRLDQGRIVANGNDLGSVWQALGWF